MTFMMQPILLPEGGREMDTSSDHSGVRQVAGLLFILLVLVADV